MTHIVGRNVNWLYPRGLAELREYGVESDSRNGRVLVMPQPVLSSYDNPKERVLFDKGRKANPFFHLFESLWMLFGSDDVKPLLHYVGDFDKFAEDDGHLHGAYGARWRWKLGRDQLEQAIDLLSSNPQSRQVVITMWQQDCDLGANAKDIPCNTQIYLRINEGRLDLTVVCRSNDAIWGAYGANAVHFTVLQEYLAGRIGVPVGRFHQFSNNFHAYLPILEKVGQPAPANASDRYLLEEIYPRSIGDNWRPGVWEEDLRAFMNWHEGLWTYGPNAMAFPSSGHYYANPWFFEVPTRMALAMWYYRQGNHAQAKLHALDVKAPDWSFAAVNWVSQPLPGHARYGDKK